MSSLALVRELSGLDTSQLRAYLDACDVPFQPSQLYSAAEDTKFVDPSLRLSEFRALTDEALFQIAEALVATVSAQDPGNDYTLVRNDVTHIRYLPGGFFSKHQDFLSLASNMVEEYTLLVCITPSPRPRRAVKQSCTSAATRRRTARPPRPAVRCSSARTWSTRAPR
jgi:hypothetical protein